MRSDRAAAHNPGRDIADRYSKLAAVYDAWSHFTESRSLDAALEGAAIRDGEAVLEIAVGTGLLFREVLRRNATGRNVGVDLAEPMLRRARRRAETTGVAFELASCDARTLSLSDASFDVVLNNNMLGLVPVHERAPILSEMRRVLRPGGRLVLVAMARPQSRLASWIYGIGAVWLGGWRDVSLEPLARAAGFDVVTRAVVTQLGIPSEVLHARKPL